jgi:3-deoxy-D-manno-octulosonate 8-phosphate phosphatase KdsC-like HAD superfamily phosphatase
MLVTKRTDCSTTTGIKIFLAGGVNKPTAMARLRNRIGLNSASMEYVGHKELDNIRGVMTSAEIVYAVIGSMIVGAIIFVIGLGFYIRHKLKNPPPDDTPDSG